MAQKLVDKGQTEFCRITFWCQFERDGKIAATKVAKIELWCRKCEPDKPVGDRECKEQKLPWGTGGAAKAAPYPPPPDRIRR